MPRRVKHWKLIAIALAVAIAILATGKIAIAASSDVELSDIRIGVPSIILGFGLLGTIWAGTSRISAISSAFTNIKRDLEAANTAISERVNHLNYISSESIRRVDKDNLELKGEIKEQELEIKLLRNKVSSLQGFLVKQGYVIRENE